MEAQIFKFETLDVYKRARSLVRKVYGLTGAWSKEYLYDICPQFRRAALSVLLNIAEGSGRKKDDFSRYLTIAEGSCKECVAVVDVAFDLGLISEADSSSLKKELTEIVMMLEGLKKSLR